MTSLTKDENPARLQIRSFVPGQIQINERVLNGNLIISAEKLIENWRPQTAEEIGADDLAVILALDPEVVLIGTGEKQLFLPPAIYGDFINRKIGVELMSTGAACRTFNVLTAERRRVVAALILK